MKCCKAPLHHRCPSAALSRHKVAGDLGAWLAKNRCATSVSPVSWPKRPTSGVGPPIYIMTTAKVNRWSRHDQRHMLVPADPVDTALTDHSLQNEDAR
jgi:hypothetical protein